MEEIRKLYEKQKDEIKSRLEDFKKISEKEYFKEFMFCLLTPQSNAQKCWEAIKLISLLPSLEKESLISILKTKTRFHNNKARYIISGKEIWPKILESLDNDDRKELRNFISENVKGYGLKEASHFLRNIGKSNNEIAILDRHILRNLKSLKIIDEDKIKNNKHYLEVEQSFLNFSKQINIPIDHLDLVFWFKEHDEFFK